MGYSGYAVVGHLSANKDALWCAGCRKLNTVEGRMRYQMASCLVGQAWQRGKGKPRHALCRKLACCLRVRALAISNGCQKAIPPPGPYAEMSAFLRRDGRSSGRQALLPSAAHVLSLLLVSPWMKKMSDSNALWTCFRIL